MNTPNLFSYATSELSQDAFLCWLISWASPEFKAKNNILSKCALNLLHLFFKKHAVTPPQEISSVKIKQQHLNIDVLVSIDDKFYFLIEDKVHTSPHSNQLNRYKEKLTAELGAKSIVLPIYLKTGYFEQNDHAEEKGYKTIYRKELIEQLKFAVDNGSTSDILNNFYLHLQKIENSLHRYATTHINKWNRTAWIGFFQYIHSQLSLEDLKYFGWDYVPNPSGGFMGCWCASEKAEEEHLPYWQLEEKKLCIKIIVDEKKLRSKRRNYWHKHIVSRSKELQLDFRKPPRFGNGQYMTVAINNGDYRSSDANGIIDLKQTMDNIHSVQKLLISLASENYHLAMPS